MMNLFYTFCFLSRTLVFFMLLVTVYMQSFFYLYKKTLQMYLLKKIISSLPQEGTVSLFQLTQEKCKCLCAWCQFRA